MKKKTVKIVAATSMAIFSLLATMTSAYAWFISILNQGADNDDFYVQRLDSPVTSISIHEFYGETMDEDYFAFNPVGIDVFSNNEFNENAALAELNEYSVDNPDHPVLILYKNEETTGLETQINLKTDFAYLGNDDDFVAAKVSTQEELDELTKQNGKYYQLTGATAADTVLYQYTNSSLLSVTFNTFSALNAAANKVEGNNERYFRVKVDEEHGSVSTVYQYDHSEQVFNMVWCDIGDIEDDQTNPLSSAVEFHFITFSDELENIISAKDVNVETYDSSAYAYSYEEQDDLDCIAVAKSSLTDSNRSSFTTFNNAGNFVGQDKEITVFSGDITGVTYVGIVVNYSSLSLEYVFSRNLGHKALNAGLVFKCDWITEF